VRFESADGQRGVEVGIFDYAHIPFLYVPFNMFLNMKVASESTEGYERSTRIRDFPAFEKWNRSGNSDAVALVGDRFIVKADTRGLGEGAGKKILEGMNLSQLASKGK
jgi:hypothetical protein